MNKTEKILKLLEFATNSEPEKPAANVFLSHHYLDSMTKHNKDSIADHYIAHSTLDTAKRAAELEHKKHGYEPKVSHISSKEDERGFHHVKSTIVKRNDNWVTPKEPIGKLHIPVGPDHIHKDDIHDFG